MSKPYCAICNEENKKAVPTFTVDRLKGLYVWNIAMHVSI